MEKLINKLNELYKVGETVVEPDAREEYPDFYDNVVMCASFENGMQGMMDGAQGVGYSCPIRFLSNMPNFWALFFCII